MEGAGWGGGDAAAGVNCTSQGVRETQAGRQSLKCGV